MYKLYYAAGTCSLAAHAIMKELNAEFTLERVDLAAPRSAEFLKLNPRGAVPVLVDGGLVLREGAAIIQYLLEKHDSTLLPKSGGGRARTLQWLMFCNATLHPAYSRVFWLMRTAKNAEEKAALIANSIANINKMYEELEEHLATNRYLAGDVLTGADFLFAVIANFGRTSFANPPTWGPNVARLLKEISSRPAFTKALASEEIEYKAAA